MRILIVEDDYTSSILMKKYLEGYGDCDVVNDGVAAVEAFSAAVESGKHYDLICLDIMLPKMDGQEVLKSLRTIETQHNITERNSAKIIMTSALGDPQNIITAFREQCEAYLTKPIDKKKLLEEIAKLGLIEGGLPS